MSFLLVLFLGGFALHCSIKEVPRETPTSFEVIQQAPVPIRFEDPQGKP